MRERGLKLNRMPAGFPGDVSLPVRERGLKQGPFEKGRRQHQSLPVRERGLKQGVIGRQQRRQKVAPRAGAWIEAPIAPWALLRTLSRSPCGSVD